MQVKLNFNKAANGATCKSGGATWYIKTVKAGLVYFIYGEDNFTSHLPKSSFDIIWNSIVYKQKVKSCK